MTAPELAALIARGIERHEADEVIDQLRPLTRERLYDLLHAARVELIRPGDSKAYLLRSAYLRLTWKARLMERIEV